MGDDGHGSDLQAGGLARPLSGTEPSSSEGSAATRAPIRMNRATDGATDGTGRLGAPLAPQAAASSTSRSIRSWASWRSISMAGTWFITSFHIVLGLVLLDVVVEGAAGVGHEHVFEGRASVRCGRVMSGLEPVGRVLGDDLGRR